MVDAVLQRAVDSGAMPNVIAMAPAGRATVRHLITHTSGVSYWFWNGEIAR